MVTSIATDQSTLASVVTENTTMRMVTPLTTSQAQER